MQNEPLVSVIIPLYNAEKYIQETILSVITQTYQNWELIVVDDCSTDGSTKLVQFFENQDDRIRLIQSKINFGGPARPRNIGLDNSKGEYIAFLDADDVWLEDKLSKQIKIIENFDIDIVHTLAYTIDAKSKRIGILKNQNFYNKLSLICNDKSILCMSNFININTVLVKKDLNIKFKEDLHLVALEDLYFWIDHLSIGKKIYLVNENLINYRILDTSISNRGSDKSYRKLFYLYSVLLNENKISLLFFLTCTLLNTIKIMARKLYNMRLS